MFYRKVMVLGTLVGVLVVALLLGVNGLVKSDPAQAQSDQLAALRQITVVGVGEVSGAPDTADVQIGVETEKKTAQDALEENNLKSTEVISKLLELEIEKKDIQTSNFSIYSTYDDKGRKVVGYRVTNVISVKIRNLEKAGDLLDEVVKVGVNSIYGISFHVEDTTDLFAQARDKAMKDARTKAEQLAKAEQATVGKALNITENIGSASDPFIMPRGLGGAEMSMTNAASTVPMQAGEQTFSTQVQVTFELK